MEATPFEHVDVLAVATYWMGEVTVAPLVGLVTVTVANAEVAVATTAASTSSLENKAFIVSPESLPSLRTSGNAGSCALIAVSEGDEAAIKA